MKIDARQHVFAIAIHANQTALPRQIHGAHDVGGIDAQHQPAESAVQRHGPDPFRQLALLQVKRRVRKVFDVAHVIEMGVRDEDGARCLRA